ncbi:MAG: hypothetical protein RLP14_02570 [Owenweeksia sp.]
MLLISSIGIGLGSCNRQNEIDEQFIVEKEQYEVIAKILLRNRDEILRSKLDECKLDSTTKRVDFSYESFMKCFKLSNKDTEKEILKFLKSSYVSHVFLYRDYVKFNLSTEGNFAETIFYTITFSPVIEASEVEGLNYPYTRIDKNWYLEKRKEATF